MKQTALFRLLLALAALIALSSPSFAQNITGSITGVVRDQSGAVIRGAQVSVTNSDTGIEIRKVTTNDDGIFTAPLLPVGHYVITALSTGFAESKLTSIDLHVNDQLKYALVLKPANAGEQVTVEANAIQVDTQSVTAAGLINGTQIRELSLNNRNYEQLVALQPGVSYGGGDQLYIGLSNPSGQTNVVSFSINGQRNSANSWTIDGADNVDRGSNLTLLNYPSIDAIAEFKTLRSLYNPEFGRDAGGQINVVTKTGTNQFHGDAYEFFRNDALNANNYFNKRANPIVPRGKLRYNNFGYTLGGPIKFHRDSDPKTFFFFSEEWRKVTTYGTFNALVPTAADRAGTFSSPVCISVSASGSCTATGTQITNVNPVAAQYLKDIYGKVSLPNAGPASPNSLISSVRNVFDYRQELVRLDHNISDKLNVSFRFINDVIPTVEPGGLFNGNNTPNLATTSTNSPAQNYLGRFTYTATPTFLIDGGYAYSKSAILSTPTGLAADANSPDINPLLPFPKTLAHIPTVSLTGYTSISGAGPYTMRDGDHQIFANLTKVLGDHAFKFGGVYHRYHKTENANGNNMGTFAFDGTGNPNPGTTSCKANPSQPACATTAQMQAFANFLSGYVTTFTQASQDLTPYLNTNQWEIYGQDSWKLRHNLTFTYGLRWSVFQSPTDSNHLLTTFDPSLYNPANASVVARSGLQSGNIVTQGDPLNGMAVNGSTSPWGAAVGPTNYLNFAPRVGLAWDVFGNGKTSVRSGYGIVYDSSLFGTYEQNEFANPPYVNSTTITGGRFDNITSGTTKVSAAPKTIHATTVSDATPYVEQYSLDIQQELPQRFILDVGYYGNSGHHLLGIADINQPQVGAYVNAGLYTKDAIVNGKFIPGVPITPANIQGSNIYAINAIRPYVGYDAINAIEPWFGSNYNSLQASLQKQFKGNSLVSVSYTFSHGLTDAQSDRSSAPQSTYCIRCEYGPSQLDRRQIFTGNYVYDLPFFAKQQGFVGHALGGWEISSILQASTGLPGTVTTGGVADPAGIGVKDGNSASGPRPDLIGDPNAGAPHSFLHWFNTGAFAQVPVGAVRTGTERRGAVTLPGFFKMDMSLFKNFKFTESTYLQFRAEAFNVLNHTNFDSVGLVSTTTSTFGQVTAARDPRIMQLALKLYF